MSKKTLVLGASLKEVRYSNMAIRRLRQNDVETVAVGLREGSVLDVEINTENVPFQDIHTVTLYLNPTRQEPFYDYILSLNPSRVIFNPGTENPEFYQILGDAGIEVDVACTLILLGSNQY